MRRSSSRCRHRDPRCPRSTRWARHRILRLRRSSPPGRCTRRSIRAPPGIVLSIGFPNVPSRSSVSRVVAAPMDAGESRTLVRDDRASGAVPGSIPRTSALRARRPVRTKRRGGSRAIVSAHISGVNRNGPATSSRPPRRAPELAPGFPRRRARRTPSPREGERARTASRDAALQRRPASLFSLALEDAAGRSIGIDVAHVSAHNRPDRYPFASPWMGRREHGDLRHPIDLGADSVRKVCFAIVSKRKADRVRNLLSPDVRVAIRHWHRRRHVVATLLGSREQIHTQERTPS